MPTLEELVRAFLELNHAQEFDPSQPRDDSGQWTDGGGSSSRRSKKKFDDQQSKVHSVVASTAQSITDKMPKGLDTKSSDLPLGEKPKHSFRWMGKDEVQAALSGTHTYGGANTSELDSGNWWSSAPADFKGYGQYLMEVDVPTGNGFGLDAPKGSVGAKNVVDIWKYDPIKDQYTSIKVSK